MGPSLQRVKLSAYGNEPTNWFANGATPGRANGTNAPPTGALSAPAGGAIIGFGPPITLTAIVSDTDGAVSLVEFFADGVEVGFSFGPAFSIAWSNAAPGAHTLTARATDDRLGRVLTAPVSITVSNQLPTVTITSPSNGVAYLLPTNLLLHATASDADGFVVKVEFYDNGTRLGEDTSSPYTFAMADLRSGAHVLTALATDNAGQTASSANVTITGFKSTYTAYIVPDGTVGSQALPNPYAIGMDFEVLSPIIVTRLGCFDSGSDGINVSSTLTTQIFNRNGPSPVIVATTGFSSVDAGELVGGSRLKALVSAVLLTNGSYSCVGYGYDSNNRNGNIGTGNAKVWTTEDGGVLAFTGGGRYGANAPGGFPTTPDAGPADRYAAGTFEFKAVPATPLIVSDPTNMFIRPFTSVTNSVFAVGNAPLRYQWSFNGTNIPGATANTLSITNAQFTNEGVYRVVVTNALGFATSAPASLVLLVDPIIVQSPLSQNLVAGTTVTLSVSVTNTATLPVGYRVRRNGVTLPTTFPGAWLSLDGRTAYFTLSGTNVAPPWTNYAIICTNLAKPGGNLSGAALLTFVADGDGDGLPDGWETQYFASTNGANANEDFDGDSMLNWQEYLAGTNPTNASSRLKIDSIAAGPGATLTFGALSNKTYTVQFTETIGTSNLWQRLADLSAHATNRLESIPDAAYTTNRFYRVVTPRQP